MFTMKKLSNGVTRSYHLNIQIATCPRKKNKHYVNLTTSARPGRGAKVDKGAPPGEREPRRADPRPPGSHIRLPKHTGTGSPALLESRPRSGCHSEGTLDLVVNSRLSFLLSGGNETQVKLPNPEGTAHPEWEERRARGRDEKAFRKGFKFQGLKSREQPDPRLFR